MPRVYCIRFATETSKRAQSVLDAYQEVPWTADGFKLQVDRVEPDFHQLLGRDPKRKYLVLDIIESSEAIELIGPLLEAIVATKLSENEFRDTMITLETNVWHLADHLKSLSDALEDEDE